MSGNRYSARGDDRHWIQFGINMDDGEGFDPDAVEWFWGGATDFGVYLDGKVRWSSGMLTLVSYDPLNPAREIYVDGVSCDLVGEPELAEELETIEDMVVSSAPGAVVLTMGKVQLTMSLEKAAEVATRIGYHIERARG